MSRIFPSTPHEIVPRIRMIWNTIASQLAKENKKFIYGMGCGKVRGQRTMKQPSCGFLTAGLSIKSAGSVNGACIPLKAYEDLKAFKLVMVDIGLLSCMTGLHQGTLLDGNDLFTEFKGALTEQYVFQQLKTLENLRLNYYTNGRNSCEHDFIVDTGENIVPVEVKAEVNLKAKSLKTYQEKFSPKISVRTSMSDFKREDWLINVPLYAIEQLTDIITG